jgi:hypothetical protein
VSLLKHGVRGSCIRPILLKGLLANTLRPPRDQEEHGGRKDRDTAHPTLPHDLVVIGIMVAGSGVRGAHLAV